MTNYKPVRLQRVLPVVTLRNFSTPATCYADLTGRDRPETDLDNRERHMEIISTSPTGRFEIQADVWEARNSLWVYTPSIWDVERNLHILSFKDDSWSADNSVWSSENHVSLILRKFPGNHRPEQLNVEIDCVARVAMIASATPMPLAGLESALNRALTWV
jgi:hypothetical protein